MPDKAEEQLRLAKIDEQIARAQELLLRQQIRITELQERDSSTDMAREILSTMEETVSIMKYYRSQIADLSAKLRS